MTDCVGAGHCARTPWCTRLMTLQTYLIRRIFLAIPLILGITVVAFLIANAIPADPTTTNLPQNALNDPELVQAFRERWGLDKPLLSNTSPI
jgi:peptide/nickel transport system permease protein